jgi:hypothetical protein
LYYIKKFILLLFFLPLFSAAQNKLFAGKVTASTQEPLENANIIATPDLDSEEMKFAIADHLGRFKMELKKAVAYQIKVSYIGYKEMIFLLPANSDVANHDFNLIAIGAQLGEVVIKYYYQPIVVKKDTVTYDVKAFANGKEFKMKEVLEKLPGIEVDKNGSIKHNGKDVNSLLVDGKLFFGGGSKLAVENIPADALDKIEMIQDYNEIGFMKSVSNSDQLALNVKLKKDKKKFVFGDVEAGKGNADFYAARAALFYYTPNYNFSYIGDANTVGARSLSSDDISRLQGNTSTLLSSKQSLADLSVFSNTSLDFTEKKTQFNAVNYNFSLGKKITLEGFALLSKNFTSALVATENTYLENDKVSIESKDRKGRDKALLSMVNMKLKYSPTPTERVTYNFHFQTEDRSVSDLMQSKFNNVTSTFLTTNGIVDSDVKQYVEWHKKYSRKHTQSFVFDHSFQHRNPQNEWISNQPFLQGILPLVNDSRYDVSQVKEIRNNYVAALFKDYWSFANGMQLFATVGNNWQNSSLYTNEKQVLSDGSEVDFASKGFGNALRYNLNDFFLATEYKFMLGKLSNMPKITAHFYALNTSQTASSIQYKPFFLELQWQSKYEISNSETLNFNYRLSNNLPSENQLVDNYILESYNTVLIGNSLLRNEKYQTSTLSYFKFRAYNYFNIFAFLTYSNKMNTIRNEVFIDGINQVVQPLQTTNPENSLSFTGRFVKNIYKFQAEISTSMSSFNYFQRINGTFGELQRNNQKIGFVVRTTPKKWPLLKVGYSKSFSQLSGVFLNSFQSSEFLIECNAAFLKHFTFTTDFTKTVTRDAFGSPEFNVANASLVFQKKSSPYRFEVRANNYLNNGFRITNTFSAYTTSNNTIYTLPRVFLFTFMYKI